MYDLGLGDLVQTPQDSCPEILIKFLATRNGRVERTTCCVNFVSSAAKLSTRNIIRENEKPLLFGRTKSNESINDPLHPLRRWEMSIFK